MEMNAPITFEMKVYATNEEAGQTAVLTMSMPRGRFLTPDSIKAYLKQAEKQLPDGYALMNKADFINELLQEEYGVSERFATPGSRDFTDEIIEGDDDE